MWRGLPALTETDVAAEAQRAQRKNGRREKRQSRNRKPKTVKTAALKLSFDRSNSETSHDSLRL